jgi:hypothetical protein
MINRMGTGNTTYFRAVGRAWQAAWLLVLASGCAAPQGVERPGGEEVVEELPIQWEKSGTWSHIKRPVRVVAYDAATLAQVPVTEVPVDFNTQMVLITALGPTLGQDIGVKITRVWREGPEVRVQETRVHPGLERSGPPERSSPWSVVVVPRYETNVRNYTSRVPTGLMGD